MLLERMAKAFDKLSLASEQRNWVYGRLGILDDNGNYVFNVPTQPGHVYVRLGTDGKQGKTIARNLGVGLTADLPIKMRRENGQLVIRAVDQGSPSYSDDDPDIPTGEGAPSPHTMDGPHHTGTISNAQAPQFLLANGDRNLTGHLGVDPGVMIDGVDLSVFKSSYDAHVANPDAHHARASAGDSSISVAAQAIAVALATGSGLETVSGLRVKTYDGIGRNNNGVYVRRATDSGFGFDGGGNLMLGTPGTITPTSVNAVNGVSHSHAVDSADDVGTTPARKILQSTPGGHVTLRSLQTKGNMDLTDGGQLYVGGGMGGANGIISTVGSTPDTARVGIGITDPDGPDPQFMLDVGGAVRAQYFVGQHAIQLKDALLLVKFDGHQIPNNYVGNPDGHMGQVGTAVGSSVAYVPSGLFDKAARLSLASTNYIQDPSFEAAAITDRWGVSGGAYIARDTKMAYVGNASCRIDATGEFTQIRGATIAVPNGTTVTAQIRVYREFLPDTATLELYNTTDGASVASVVTTEDESDVWELLIVSWTNSTGSSKNIRFQASRPGGGQLGACWFDAAQLETGTPTPYFDGTMPGCSWTGAAHYTSSTCGNTQLRYSTLGNINWAEGTIMAWVMLPNPADGRIKMILRADGASDTYVIVRVAANGLLGAMWGTTTVNSNTALTAGKWHHVAVTNDGRNIKLYIDGIEQANTGTAGTVLSPPSAMYLGGNGINTSQHFCGLVEEFVIVSNPLHPKLVRSIAESNAPVFAGTSTFSLRAGSRQLIRFDENGFWMRDVDGNAVMGIYGGDASTHNWGGIDMTRGDLLVGSASKGYLFWDNDALTNNLRMHNAAIEMTGSPMRYVKINPDDGILVGSRSAVYPINDNNPPVPDPFGGVQIDHVLETGRVVLQMGETGTKHQGLLAVYNSFSPNETEMLIQALTHEATTDTRDANVILQARAWGITNDPLPGPYSRESRVAVSAADGITLQATGTAQQVLVNGQLSLMGMQTSNAILGAYSGKIRLVINGVSRWIAYYAS